MPRKRDSEAYESDGGFVEGAPKSKKSKKTEVQKREVKEVDLEKHTDDEGNPYFQVSNPWKTDDSWTGKNRCLAPSKLGMFIGLVDANTSKSSPRCEESRSPNSEGKTC